MPHRDPTITRHRDPGLDLLEIRAPVFRMTIPRGRKRRVTVRIGAVQGDRGHVPMQPGHIDPERCNRRRTDRPDDLLGPSGDRVQRPTQAVVIEHIGRHPEDFRHRPQPGPVRDPDHRRRMRQPVRDQHLDHLTMRDIRQITDRTSRIDDSGDIDPPTEIGDHRQRPQPLLQHLDHRDLRPRTPHHTTPRRLRHTHPSNLAIDIDHTKSATQNPCAKYRSRGRRLHGPWS